MYRLVGCQFWLATYPNTFTWKKLNRKDGYRVSYYSVGIIFISAIDLAAMKCTEEAVETAFKVLEIGVKRTPFLPDDGITRM